MIAAAKMVDRIQECYAAEPELVRTLLCAASIVEVELALEILRETVPPRTLVAALALREALTAIPRFPCTMAVDEETLARVAHLEKDRLAWKKDLESDCGLGVTMAGNFCFDVILRMGTKSLFITPSSPASDIVDPAAVTAFIEHPELLGEVVSLLSDMGIQFNPKPYLSLEDWALDHAQAAIEDVRSLF